MPKCVVHPFETFENPRFVVILSRMDGKYLLSRHKNRVTWETQGGYIEKGETPFEAAKRELWEESGAVEYTLTPLCDYWATTDAIESTGRVYCAEITKLGPIPEGSEMRETKLFDTLPEEFTYTYISKVLFAYKEEAEN